MDERKSEARRYLPTARQGRRVFHWFYYILADMKGFSFSRESASAGIWPIWDSSFDYAQDDSARSSFDCGAPRLRSG
jgi:hypothetical protein